MSSLQAPSHLGIGVHSKATDSDIMEIYAAYSLQKSQRNQSQDMSQEMIYHTLFPIMQRTKDYDLDIADFIRWHVIITVCRWLATFKDTVDNYI